MVRVVRWVMVLVNWGNWIVQAAFLAMLASLLVGIGPLPARLAAHARPGQGPAMIHLLEAVLCLGPLITIAVHMICTRVIAMIDTLTEGAPFVAANAKRLREIGWALLGIQIIDLVYGRLAWMMSAASGRHLPWVPALTGWIAVLLVFVLARVFAAGTTMQNEIEATV